MYILIAEDEVTIAGALKVMLERNKYAVDGKPMVNPSKWANLKSNFLKFHHRNQVISGIEKARKMAYFRAFLAF